MEIIHKRIRSLEGLLLLAGLDDSAEEGEGTILELHDGSLQFVECVWQLEELEDDWLVLAQHLSAGNAVDESIALLLNVRSILWIEIKERIVGERFQSATHQDFHMNSTCLKVIVH